MKAPKLNFRRRPRRARRLKARAEGKVAQVPGLSNNPATNLLIDDIAMRGVTMLLGRGIEKGVLALRYDVEKAQGIVEGRTMARSLASTAAARVATRSLPGFLLVSGGLLAKSVFDRSLGRREAVKRGDEQLEQQADKANTK